MSANNTAPRASSGRRALRYAVRVPLLLLHLGLGLPITLLAILLPIASLRLASGERIDHNMIRWWSGVLVHLFGFRVSVRGTPHPGAALLVANHVSWLDIELIHSRRMACFVAKSEIESWPVVGWVASRAGTIYHRRGSTESLGAVQQVMVQRLRQGLAVAVFPEGGAGPGDHVRTFHARIFQAAVDASVPAQPVALRFTRDGALTTAISFAAGESFLANFLRLLGEPLTTAEVIFLDPVTPNGDGRRRLANACRSQIVQALGVEDRRRAGSTGPQEPATDDLDPLSDAGPGS